MNPLLSHLGGVLSLDSTEGKPTIQKNKAAPTKHIHLVCISTALLMRDA